MRHGFRLAAPHRAVEFCVLFTHAKVSFGEEVGMRAGPLEDDLSSVYTVYE